MLAGDDDDNLHPCSRAEAAAVMGEPSAITRASPMFQRCPDGPLAAWWMLRRFAVSQVRAACQCSDQRRCPWRAGRTTQVTTEGVTWENHPRRREKRPVKIEVVKHSETMTGTGPSKPQSPQDLRQGRGIAAVQNSPGKAGARRKGSPSGFQRRAARPTGTPFVAVLPIAR